MSVQPKEVIIDGREVANIPKTLFSVDFSYNQLIAHPLTIIAFIIFSMIIMYIIYKIAEDKLND